MKAFILPCALLCVLVTAGCNTDITITPPATAGGASVFTPKTATAAMGRKDTVTFVNNDDRFHVIVVGPAGLVASWPAGLSITPPTNPLAPTAAIPNPPPDPRYAACTVFRVLPGQSVVWNVPLATAPPATLSWRCISHAGEFGTITVNP